jgi:hypothetical protein
VSPAFFAVTVNDLGTLIPFLVGYVTVTRMDPVGVLVAFGLFRLRSASTSRRRCRSSL